MNGRVIEIASDGRHLAVSRGFMTISAEGHEVGRVPLDDIGVLLCHAHGLTYSNNLMVALTERGVAIVICGANHMPVAWIWPLDGHHVQSSVFGLYAVLRRQGSRTRIHATYRKSIAEDRACSNPVLHGQTI